MVVAGTGSDQHSFKAECSLITVNRKQHEETAYDCKCICYWRCSKR